MTGARTTITGDHDDQGPLPEVSQCRVWIAVARSAIAEIAGLPNTPQRAARRAEAEKILSYNAARLRELMEHRHAA